MRIFKTRYFSRWARAENLKDSQLKKTIKEVEEGLSDGNLGGYLYKKRVAIRGIGKRGGLRTIIAYKKKDKAFFVYGYPKNARDNINLKEKEAFKQLAKVYFSLDELSLEKLIERGELTEVI